MGQYLGKRKWHLIGHDFKEKFSCSSVSVILIYSALHSPTLYVKIREMHILRQAMQAFQKKKKESCINCLKHLSLSLNDRKHRHYPPGISYCFQLHWDLLRQPVDNKQKNLERLQTLQQINGNNFRRGEQKSCIVYQLVKCFEGSWVRTGKV